MKRLAFVLLKLMLALPSIAAAQGRDTTLFLGVFNPRIGPSVPAWFAPLYPSTGTSLGLPGLAVNNVAFPFDTSTSGAKSQNVIVNAVGYPITVSDPCMTENLQTVVNKGITNANCHAINIPAFSGTFGSNNALQVNATSSFVRNASNQGAGKLNASGGLETCRAITDLAQCWGTTVYATDTSGAHGILIGLQSNVLLQNSPASYTGAAATPRGYYATLTDVNSGDIGVAYGANNQPGIARWLIGYQTQDSAAATGMDLGSTGKGPSTGSQPIVLHWRDGSSVSQTTQINADGSGNLTLTAGSSSNVIVSSPMLVSGGRVQDAAVALTCGGSTTPAINVAQGNYFTCNITSNVAVVLAVPTNNPSTSTRSQLIRVAFRNSSGGALGTAPTFNAGAGGYKFTGTCNPANGTQCVWAFTFDQGQGFWYLVGGTPTGL